MKTRYETLDEAVTAAGRNSFYLPGTPGADVQNIWDLVPMLPPRNQRIIRAYYTDDGRRQTLAQIGQKEGGTPERIRQILGVSLRSLYRLAADRDQRERVEAGGADPRELMVFGVGLSTKARTAVQRCSYVTASHHWKDVRTLGDLTLVAREDLERLRNVGAGTLREIEEMLASFGLSLATPDPQTGLLGGEAEAAAESMGGVLKKMGRVG